MSRKTKKQKWLSDKITKGEREWRKERLDRIEDREPDLLRRPEKGRHILSFLEELSAGDKEGVRAAAIDGAVRLSKEFGEKMAAQPLAWMIVPAMYGAMRALGVADPEDIVNVDENFAKRAGLQMKGIFDCDETISRIIKIGDDYKGPNSVFCHGLPDGFKGFFNLAIEEGVGLKDCEKAKDVLIEDLQWFRYIQDPARYGKKPDWRETYTIGRKIASDLAGLIDPKTCVVAKEKIKLYHVENEQYDLFSPETDVHLQELAGLNVRDLEFATSGIADIYGDRLKFYELALSTIFGPTRIRVRGSEANSTGANFYFGLDKIFTLDGWLEQFSREARKGDHVTGVLMRQAEKIDEALSTEPFLLPSRIFAGQTFVHEDVGWVRRGLGVVIPRLTPKTVSKALSEFSAGQLTMVVTNDILDAVRAPFEGAWCYYICRHEEGPPVEKILDWPVFQVSSFAMAVAGANYLKDGLQLAWYASPGTSYGLLEDLAYLRRFVGTKEYKKILSATLQKYENHEESEAVRYTRAWNLIALEAEQDLDGQLIEQYPYAHLDASTLEMIKEASRIAEYKKIGPLYKIAKQRLGAISKPHPGIMGVEKNLKEMIDAEFVYSHLTNEEIEKYYPQEVQLIKKEFKRRYNKIKGQFYDAHKKYERLINPKMK